MQKILHIRGAQAVMLVASLLLVMSTLISALVISPVEAAQVTSRKITMGSSAAGATTTYAASFVIPSSTVGSFRISFCDNNPLPGTACTFTTADNVPDLDAATVSVAGALTGATVCTTISMTAIGAGQNYVDFTCNAAETDGGTFTVTLGNIVNPTNTTDTATEDNNTFYARLYTFTALTPTAYATTPEPAGNNDGGVALSTANQLNITARVQEVLEFCVGDDYTAVDATDDCTDVSGSTIDIGVLDSSTTNKSSVDATVTATDGNGYVMVRTNALTGVNIDYYGGDASGDLVSGANTIPALGTQGALVANTANWGMEVDNGGDTNGGINLGASATTATNQKLVLDANFNVDNQAFWGATATVADDLAGSTEPVDDELIVLDFHGAANITTPSGIYTTTITFVATGTF